MEEKEKQELNEKLKVFSGFTKRYIDDTTSFYWRYTDGTEYGTELDFLDPIKGLGLMFKYAVPKAKYKSIEFFKYKSGWLCVLGLGQIEEEGDTPTTALALALGKLIDSIEKGGSGITT